VKVFVISDMEGIAGIVRPEQTNAGEALYEEGRKLYTQEINAAVRGAKAGGATEIVVMDCHGAGKGYNFNSLLPEDLERPRVRRRRNLTEYTEFLEQGGRGAVRRCMRGRAQAAACSSTRSRARLPESWFNGTPVGETGINAALRHLGLPGAARHRRRRLPRRHRPRRRSHRRGSRDQERARCNRQSARTRGGSSQALDLKAVEPYDPGRPCEIKVEYKWTAPAARLRYRSGVELLDARTLVSRADDWWTAWKQFFF
jgi:D-amino peptidase